MNKLIKLLSLPLLGFIALSAASVTNALPEAGQPAPDFEVVDTNGETVSLSQLKGKTVVLEWTNHECPFVVKHYGSGNMQTLQKEAVADNVVWVSVISSGEGKQGYVDAAKANQLSSERDASPSHILLDPTGELGHLYAAKTTPHMFVINAQGQLAYMGGIDSKASADPADIASATNYVRSALTEIKGGKPVTTSTSRPYGCSVKYKS